MQAANLALAGLYETYARELHGIARRCAGRQEAEDIVQDTYLHLLQRGTAATLKHARPHLYRITPNLAVDFARKTKVRPHLSDCPSRNAVTNCSGAFLAVVSSPQLLRRFDH